MNLPIETLRGLACLLLVAYHVVGADPSNGLRLEDGTLRWLNDGLAYLRMPLFTFLSGLVYGWQPFAGNSRAFLQGKARRLLVPMLVVGSLFALLQANVAGTHAVLQPWYLTHLKPVGHFWFVESLFWVFLLIWALECRRWLHSLWPSLAVMAAACALYLTLRGWPWLGLEGAIYLLPYFLAGMLMSRFPEHFRLDHAGVQMSLLLVAVGGVVLMGMPVPNPDRRTVLMLLTGLALCLLCLSAGLVIPWLARIGADSYPIYIFHVFFTAASRIVLQRCGVESLALLMVSGLVLGLLGPMWLARVVSPYRWPAFLLLGKSLRGPRPRAERQALQSVSA